LRVEKLIFTGLINFAAEVVFLALQAEEFHTSFEIVARIGAQKYSNHQ
jgi:hypothetical protein